ncbi:YdaS family helix-turn-helix protein [uncultured Pseudacidovorax sp.]|uniref:transcriptional regulator n=1 Tax=uncultured Pseudacidovorax sp. TaxID=679313 RepID=UPI0025F958FF|nr:YdaS family helix-turn-helix protein [uncultured Pseudacidovorax sp.]
MKTLHDWLSETRGRTKALAMHLRVPSSMVSKMASGEKQIPLDHCPYIEAFTGGEVPCELQRPDKVDYFRMLQRRGLVAKRSHDKGALRVVPARGLFDGASSGAAHG